MARYYNTDQALAAIMEPDPEPMDHDSETSITSESDTDTDSEDEEYLPGVGSSSHSSTDSTDGGEVEADQTRRSKNGEILWAPTNERTLQFNPPATGITPGPTRYVVARVGELADSFHLFFNTTITDLILQYTNLHGRRTVTGWKDLDATTIQPYIGSLLLAGVYRSRGEATHSLWDGQSGRPSFSSGHAT
ncbi:hypothetical protein GBF38_005570 [Nibea albiflora]|uniref:Uncharacterized protein n=1 Tax=Nibea albiflora TaxID=240163 RepID=A0ACB7EX45_NIBAL|nr:hypothetical protein GBF38_005570 [Nibea albiflora]